MPQHAPWLGLAAVTGRARRLQGPRVSVARVCHVATGTGEVPIEPWGAGWCHLRHHQTRGAALVGHLDLDDRTARARPWARWVAGRVQAGRLAPPARLGPPGLLEDLVGQLGQHRVAREAYAVAPVGVGFAPRPHLGRGKVTVTTTDAPGGGPRVPQPLAHPRASCQHVGTAAARGLKDRRDQTPREACMQVAWQETLATIIAIVAALCLCPMRAVRGGIDLEHHDRGWTVVGRHKLIHQYESHARNRRACDTGFKA